MIIEIKMPSLRPGAEDAEKPVVLCQWDAAPGDILSPGDLFFEVETAKVVSGIEADAKIRILSLLAEEGDEILPGTVIATAETVDVSTEDGEG